MKTSSYLTASLALLSLVGALAVSARTANDRLSLYQGFIEIGFAEQGELGLCPPPPEGLPPSIVARHTYARLAGVCDDQSDRPCAGRFTLIRERCLAHDVLYRTDDDPPNSYFDPIHPAQVFYVRGPVRICYDETAAGHCSDVDEIARGEALLYFNDHYFPNPPPADNFITWDFTNVAMVMQTITHSKSVKVDGKHVKVRKGVAYGPSYARLNQNCLFSFDEEGNFILRANQCPESGSLLEELVKEIASGPQ